MLCVRVAEGHSDPLEPHRTPRVVLSALLQVVGEQLAAGLSVVRGRERCYRQTYSEKQLAEAGPGVQEVRKTRAGERYCPRAPPMRPWALSIRNPNLESGRYSAGYRLVVGVVWDITCEA